MKNTTQKRLDEIAENLNRTDPEIIKLNNEIEYLTVIDKLFSGKLKIIKAEG